MCSGCVCVEEQEPNISIASTITFQPKMGELISYLYLYANYNAVINTEGQKDVESFQEGRQKQENKRNEKFNLLCNKEVNLEQLQNSLFLQFSACTRQIHYQFILHSNHVKLLKRIPKIFTNRTISCYYTVQLPECFGLLFSCANYSYCSLNLSRITNFKQQSKTEMNSGSCSQ